MIVSSNILAIILFAAAPGDVASPATRRGQDRTKIQSRLLEMRDSAKRDSVPLTGLHPIPSSANGAAGIFSQQTLDEDAADTELSVPQSDTPSPDKDRKHRRTSEAIPIGRSMRPLRTAESAPDPPTATGSLFTIFSSLAIVIGLFLCVIWVSRRGWGIRQPALSTDVVEIVGRAPLTARQHLQLIKFADRLLLVAVTADSSETLAEITDPDEITRVRALCARAKPDSNASSFREVFSALNSESPT